MRQSVLTCHNGSGGCGDTRAQPLSLTCTCEIWGLLRAVLCVLLVALTFAMSATALSPMEAGQKLRLKKWLGQRLKVPGNELECAAIACIKAGVLLPVDWDGLQVALEWFISCKTSKQNTTTNKQNNMTLAI